MNNIKNVKTVKKRNKRKKAGSSKTVKMILLGCCFGIITGSLYLIFIGSGNREAAEALFEKITAYNLVGDYPKTPVDVIQINNEIMLYLYSGATNSSEMGGVIGQQRKLLSTGLLKANPLDEQVEKMKRETSRLKRFGRVMEEMEILDTTYNDSDNSSCEITVIQRVNRGEDMVVSYHLILDGQKWKIASWETAE